MPDKLCSQCGAVLSKRFANRGICRQCISQKQGTGATGEQEDGEDRFWAYMYSKWWGNLLLAAALFGFAWLVSDYITGLEESGQSGRIHWLIAIVYMAAGKFAAVSCFGLPAAV